MKTLKILHQNGSTFYGSLVRSTPLSVILELDDDKKTNQVFSLDGNLIVNEMETDLMKIDPIDLPRLQELIYLYNLPGT